MITSSVHPVLFLLPWTVPVALPTSQWRLGVWLGCSLFLPLTWAVPAGNRPLLLLWAYAPHRDCVASRFTVSLLAEVLSDPLWTGAKESQQGVTSMVLIKCLGEKP